MPELRQRKMPPGKKSRVSPRNTNNAPSQTLSERSVAAMEPEGPDDPREREPLLAGASLSQRPSSSSPPPISADVGEAEEDEMNIHNMSRKSQWIILALASGGCAAFNGVFAKLTTTELTTTFATAIAKLIGLGDGEKVVEVVVRAMFFGLNLIFNGIMWTLFTKALARGTSTTQVSILNTSSNFMITALLGFIIFSESLPPLWWLGAGLLVAGNVIIGRREEEEGKDGDEQTRAENGAGTFSSREEDEGLLVGEVLELDEDLEGKGDEEDVLDFGLDEEEGRKNSEELLIRT